MCAYMCFNNLNHFLLSGIITKPKHICFEIDALFASEFGTCYQRREGGKNKGLPGTHYRPDCALGRSLTLSPLNRHTVESPGRKRQRHQEKPHADYYG